VQIQDVPFAAINWETVAPIEHRGVVGAFHERAIETGNVRVRMVEYSPGYIADHWCSRGHIFLVLAGETVVELEDGRTFPLNAGMSFQVADGFGAHRVTSEKGAKTFIVD
jgi:quercetin dioxygenase-like cupin family protein